MPEYNSRRVRCKHLLTVSQGYRMNEKMTVTKERIWEWGWQRERKREKRKREREEKKRKRGNAI